MSAQMKTVFEGKPSTLTIHPRMDRPGVGFRDTTFTLVGENRLYSPAKFLHLFELETFVESGRLPKDAYEWAVVQYMEDAL